MKSVGEKTIDARVAAALADILPDTESRSEILKDAQLMVRAVWTVKI